MHRNPSADEHSGSQSGELLAAAPAGRVGSVIVADHHSSLLEVPKMVLQVATEALSRENNTKMSGIQVSGQYDFKSRFSSFLRIDRKGFKLAPFK